MKIMYFRMSKIKSCSANTELQSLKHLRGKFGVAKRIQKQQQLHYNTKIKFRPNSIANA